MLAYAFADISLHCFRKTFRAFSFIMFLTEFYRTASHECFDKIILEERGVDFLGALALK